MTAKACPRGHKMVKGRCVPENEYEAIKDLLKKKGWKEQWSGEFCSQGTCGTNFYDKEGYSVMHVSWNMSPDEEEIDLLKGKR